MRFAHTYLIYYNTDILTKFPPAKWRAWRGAWWQKPWQPDGKSLAFLRFFFLHISGDARISYGTRLQLSFYRLIKRISSYIPCVILHVSLTSVTFLDHLGFPQQDSLSPDQECRPNLFLRPPVGRNFQLGNWNICETIHTGFSDWVTV